LSNGYSITSIGQKTKESSSFRPNAHNSQLPNSGLTIITLSMITYLVEHMVLLSPEKVTVSTKMMEPATLAPYGAQLEIQLIRATTTRTQIEMFRKQDAQIWRVAQVPWLFTVKLSDVNGSNMKHGTPQVCIVDIKEKFDEIQVDVFRYHNS
jgi:hypothetical protein